MFAKIFSRKPAAASAPRSYCPPMDVEAHAAWINYHLTQPLTYRAAQEEAHSACSPFSHSATDHFLSSSEGCWLLDD